MNERHSVLVDIKKKKRSNIEVANSIQYCKKEISVSLLPHPNMVSFIVNRKSKNNLSIITLCKILDNSISNTYVRFFCNSLNYLRQRINDRGSLANANHDSTPIYYICVCIYTYMYIYISKDDSVGSLLIDFENGSTANLSGQM